MKKITSLICGLLCASLVQAQVIVPKTNPTGQVTMKRSGTLLKRKAVDENKEYDTVIRRVDLRPYAPPVAQQPYVNCYAYASTYTGRTILYNITGNITWHPDSTIFSTAFLQKLIYPKPGTCRRNGYDTYIACQLLRDKGAVFRSDFPVDCSSESLSAALVQKALKYRVAANQIYEACDNAGKKEAAIKASLGAGLPVVIGWYSVSSFNGGGYGVECWTPTPGERRLNACREGANHAVCIIGFDDDKFGGAFQIMNSWGTEWGKQGLMWITYADMAQFSAFGVELANPQR